MQHFAHLLEKEFGVRSDLPSMGAAGGAAMGILSLTRGKIENGARYVMKTLRFKEAARSADLIITGEGCLDAQTASGKTVAEVATQAAALGIPALAVAGTIALNEREIEDLGLIRAVSLYEKPPGSNATSDQHKAAISKAVSELLKKS
jgi:glycerate kinase